MPRRVESIMGEEDRKKYEMAQASQRAAGGGYMPGPPIGQFYEVDDAELRKGGWKDSAEYLGQSKDRSEYQRADSSGSRVGSCDAGPYVDGTLAMPRPASTVQIQRSGRSPLGRASLIRTASAEYKDIELEDQR